MAPNPDAEALERGILEHPHEFVRWAVYADYLTEQGDPRGEFMRVQLDLEDESLSVEDRRTLKRREAEILAEHERTWLGPLANFTVDHEGERPVIHRFERGWLSAISFDRLRVEQARALAACTDARLLRELTVSRIAYEDPLGEGEEWPADGDDSELFRPGSDVPANVEYDAGLHALRHCPHLRGIRSFTLGEYAPDNQLHFRCYSSGDLAADLISRMPFVEELGLYAHDIDTKALFALPMPFLKSLSLFHNSNYPLGQLAANPSLTKLAMLRCHPRAIAHNADAASIGLKQLKAICRSPHLTSLSHLCLRLTDFGDDGAKEIVKSGILKRLRVMDLFGGCMGDDGAKLLAACPDFKNLEFANLRNNAISVEGVGALEATGVKLDLDDQHNVTFFNYDSTDALPNYLFDGDWE